jgi:hypothetical protein
VKNGSILLLIFFQSPTILHIENKGREGTFPGNGKEAEYGREKL